MIQCPRFFRKDLIFLLFSIAKVIPLLDFNLCFLKIFPINKFTHSSKTSFARLQTSIFNLEIKLTKVLGLEQLILQ